MEFRGLALALQKLFPSHQFVVEPYSPGKPFHGFTPFRVRPLLADDPLGHAAKMLRAALGTVVQQNNTIQVADFAYVIEDLELCNKGNEAVVIKHVRESALRILFEMLSLGPAVNAAHLMRERISFHLAVPMPESWFFGDSLALQTEVPPANWPPRLASNRDPEDFLTDDSDYDADDGSQCRDFARGKIPKWVSSERTTHPKKYVQWLMRNSELADCSSYKEQHEGVRLLGKLDWSAVLSRPTWFPYLRALVRDLENALGETAVRVAAGGNEASLTSIFHLSADPILRNI